MTRLRLSMIAASLLLLISAGCTDAFLFDPSVDKKGAEDRAVSVRGELCTEPTGAILRPRRILVAMDTSLSMSVTDPNGTRAKALVDLLNSLPDEPEISVGIFLFAGEINWLTNGGTSGFVQLVGLTQTDRQQLAATLLTYAYAGAPGGPNRDTTDFVKPLDEIFATISRDISASRNRPTIYGTPERADYEVIFLSDGHPRQLEDADIFARCTAIHGLRAEAADVRLHAVHVFLPDQPVPLSCADPMNCAATVIEDDAARLRKMADLGGGEFRSFRNGEPINFLAFRLGGTRRAFEVKEALLYNLTARPGTSEPDSDMDGLSDAREAEIGSDPTKRDTDNDGFSDGVEQYFRERGAPLLPAPTAEVFNSQNRGCPFEQLGVDADKDGLLDCDEQLLGTAGNSFDADKDGIPDVVEWLSGTQPASPDTEEDPDRDGLKNAQELRLHSDPLVAEAGDLSDHAYRVKLTGEPVAKADGSRCYAFTVDNVLLAKTLDAGKGAGVNELLFSVAETGADDPDGPPVYRVARFTARYPLDGIKDPPDGVLPLTPKDFVTP